MTTNLDKAIGGLEAIMKKRFESKPEWVKKILEFLDKQGKELRVPLLSHLIQFYGVLENEDEVIRTDSMSDMVWKELSEKLKSAVTDFKAMVNHLNLVPDIVAERLLRELMKLKAREQIVFLTHILYDINSFVPYVHLPQNVVQMSDEEYVERREKLRLTLMKIDAALANRNIKQKTVRGSAILSLIKELAPEDASVAMAHLIGLAGERRTARETVVMIGPSNLSSLFEMFK